VSVKRYVLFSNAYMKKLEGYKVKPFEVACMNCVYRSTQEKKEYDGVVNHHYEIVSPIELNITYTCFACKSEWKQSVNFLSEKHMGKPQSGEEVLKREGAKEKVIH
jgi:hypothetical protein